MNFETLFSIAMLGAFIWAVRFLLPKALKEHNALALTSVVLTAVRTPALASNRREDSKLAVKRMASPRGTALILRQNFVLALPAA